MQIYSLISSLKTYHPTLYLTPWSLYLFIRVPFQLHGGHTVLQPFRRIELIVHLCPTRYSFSTESSEAFEGEVPCPRTHHLNNFPRLRGEKNGENGENSAPSGIRNRTAGSDIDRAPCSNHCAMSLSGVVDTLYVLISTL